MMNRLAAAVLGASVLLLTLLPGSAAASVAASARVFTAALSGASEVPPVTTGATGAAQVVISADGREWPLLTGRFEPEASTI